MQLVRISVLLAWVTYLARPVTAPPATVAFDEVEAQHQKERAAATLLQLYCVNGTIPAALGFPFPINISLDLRGFSTSQQLSAQLQPLCEIPPFVPTTLHRSSSTSEVSLTREQLRGLRDGESLWIQIAAGNLTVGTGMLEAVTAQLRKVGAHFFLEGGELLGAVRQQSLIGSNWASGGLPLGKPSNLAKVFERDIDIGMFTEHQELVHSESFSAAMRDIQCQVVQESRSKTRILTYQGLGDWLLHVDIFWFELRGDVRFNTPHYQLPAALLSPDLPEAQISGQKYPIPRHAEFLLERLYGGSWTRERPGVKPSYGVTASAAGFTHETADGSWVVHPDVWAKVREEKHEL